MRYYDQLLINLEAARSSKAEFLRVLQRYAHQNLLGIALPELSLVELRYLANLDVSVYPLSRSELDMTRVLAWFREHKSSPGRRPTRALAGLVSMFIRSGISVETDVACSACDGPTFYVADENDVVGWCCYVQDVAEPFVGSWEASSVAVCTARQLELFEASGE